MAWPTREKREESNMAEELASLSARVTELEQKYGQKATSTTRMENIRSVHKVEEFNGEVVPDVEDNKMKMGYLDKIQSLKNALKILPPNLIKDGRHSAKNAGAICGFIVTDEMMDDAYADFSHEA